MWLSVLPGSNFAISDHLFPSFLCASIISISSSSVHLFFLISGFKWLCHLKSFYLDQKMSIEFIAVLTSLCIIFQFYREARLLFSSNSRPRVIAPYQWEFDPLPQSKVLWSWLDSKPFAIYGGITHQFCCRKRRQFFSNSWPKYYWHIRNNFIMAYPILLYELPKLVILNNKFIYKSKVNLLLSQSNIF